MTDKTARLDLPLLHSGQAQKELAHNEALTLLDAVVQATVAGTRSDPPIAPSEFGQCWIVGGNASGDWAGKEDAIAVWTAGGWRFVAPVNGMAVFDTQQMMSLRFHSGGWALGTLRGESLVLAGVATISGPKPAIPQPGGGTTIDAEARFAINAILSALQGHALIGS